MRRKNGFSLVELLIVLAVIAALIAVVTPIALNAIAGAKASQVAQNVKTISSALENTVLIDGPTALVGGSAVSTASADSISSTELNNLVRDLKAGEYSATIQNMGSGKYQIVVTYVTGDVNADKVQDIIESYDTTNNSYTFSVQVY